MRIGGPWQNWPKQLTVQADSLHTVFIHAAESQPSAHPRTSETFGYHLSVTTFPLPPHTTSPLHASPLSPYKHTLSARQVTASKRWAADRLQTPHLVQLRTSLFYLGAKCACLLCSAEPVEKEERENRHWLLSPLLSRGLPLQLDAKHPLMHPFFGIRNAHSEVEASLQVTHTRAPLASPCPNAPPLLSLPSSSYSSLPARRHFPQ